MIKALNEFAEQARVEEREVNAKIAEDHYEDHCCEDCPCAYWRENVSKTIRSGGNKLGRLEGEV